MAQTAVEWLEARVAERIYNNQMESPYWHLKQFIKDFEQAKQMEKEQKEKAHIEGQPFHSVSSHKAEQYYTQTYTRLQNQTNSKPNQIPPPPTPPASRFLKEGKEPPKRNQLK